MPSKVGQIKFNLGGAFHFRLKIKTLFLFTAVLNDIYYFL